MGGAIIEIKSELNLSAAFIFFKIPEQRGVKIGGFKGKKGVWAPVWRVYKFKESKCGHRKLFFLSKNYQIMMEKG